MSDLRERIRRIKDEEQRMNISGYQADPYSRQRLETNRHEGVPIQRRGPRNVLVRPEGDGWIVEADGRVFVGQTALDAENEMRAFYGQTLMVADWRDPRDDAPKTGSAE